MRFAKKKLKLLSLNATMVNLIQLWRLPLFLPELLFLEGLDQLGKSLSVKLPKGASQQVIEMGRALVAKQGREVLETVAKIHFKTYQQCLEN